jgi:thiamine biosynthesis protein ThiS
VSQLQLQVNGDPRTITGPATLLDLLGQLTIDPRMVVVELNREIVRRPRLGEVTLKEGDQVELVHFVGGG